MRLRCKRYEYRKKVEGFFYPKKTKKKKILEKKTLAFALPAFFSLALIAFRVFRVDSVPSI